MTLTLAQAAALFTAPGLAVAGAAAVAIPIAIHLLSRTRRRTQHWAAMRFLQQAYRQHKRRVLLEQWLLLLIRCLIVGLLGLALAGPLVAGLSNWLGHNADTGRTIELVINNGLSSQARGVSSATRLDKLRRAALAVINAAGPRDRLALWTASRPAAALISDPSVDHDKLIAALKTLRPTDTRPDLPAALAAVADHLKSESAPRGSAVVVILSDFSRSADYLNHDMTDQTAALAGLAKVIVTHPAPAAGNIQLASLSPRRQMVLTDDGNHVRTLVQAVAQRFGSSASPATGVLNLQLLDPAGQTLASVQRPIRWAPGQSRQTLNVALEAKLPDAALAGSNIAPLVLQGKVESDDGSNAITADDTRWATITARNHLRIAVASAGMNVNANQPSPAQWLSFALYPGAGPIRVTDRLASQISPEALKDLDGLVLTRPDLLDKSAWHALGHFARRGGLVWITPPASLGSAQWVQPMLQTFDLHWHVALESAASENPHGDQLDPSAAVPEPLALLAADWKSLLAPVRITRRLPMSVPPSDNWLSLSDDTGKNKNARCLLAAQPVGAGEIVFLAAAVHPDWTNLEAKPLFVPLVQEAIRGILGQPHTHSADNLCGDTLHLGPTWLGNKKLIAYPWTAPENQPAAAINLTTGKDTLAAAAPLQFPGVYAGASGKQLAVNVDPAGGDTRATSNAALTRYFDALGQNHWSFLNWSNPGAAVIQTVKRTNLAWPLLWIVLGLILLETVLARIFSHANRLGETGLLGRAGRVVRSLANPANQRSRTGRAA